MLLRRQYLEKDRGMSDAGEYTVDITPREPITCLWVKLQATNGATSCRNNTLAENISAIEIIDGADVVFSLSGVEAYALACRALGRMPFSVFDEDAGQSQTVMIPILFGRFIGDSELAFDPTKYSNPQVRIKWNLAAVTAVGATGFVALSLQLSIIAELMIGVSAPAALLSGKRIYTYTTAAGGYEYIEMPTDEPWRYLFLRGYKLLTDWHWIYDEVKLSCDGGKFVAFDMRGWDMVQRSSLYQAPFHYMAKRRAINAQRVQFVLRFGDHATPISDGTGDTVYELVHNANGEGTIGIRTTNVAAAANVNYYENVEGYHPYDVHTVVFGRPDEIGDFFPAQNYGSVRLEVKAGVAAALQYIFLQTLRLQ